MKAISTLVTAAAIASALAGCSVTANEAPCKGFESAYNQVDPGSTGSSAYGAALTALVDRIKPDAQNVAVGEVQKSMMGVVTGQDRYKLSQKPDGGVDATPVDVRKEINDSIAGVAKACKDSGYPISLPTDDTTS
jgi:expansin (peptidoglycan-binding protein)